MKKIIPIILSVLLVLSTTGVFLSKHYCNNHLVSVSLYSKAKDCCGSKCNKCKNVNHSYKVTHKFVDSKTLTNNISVTNLPLIEYFVKSTMFLQSLISFEFTGIKSPPIKDCLQILNSNFRL